MKKFLVVFVLLITMGGSLFAQNYSTHKVQQNEKIEDIAKKYLVSVYDIYTLNPDAKNGLKPNMVLIIPKTKVQAELTTVKELTGYKQHRVKRKQTLYSIAKSYNVTTDEIKKANTFLYAEPLRKGTKIRIPLYKTKQVLEEVNAPLEVAKDYIVLPKEGKWRVAYKFGITVDELEALNPELAEVLKVGDTIKVPNIDRTTEKTVEDNYSYYEVQPKEGYYRLKVKLGLTQDQLEALNPELRDSGLKVGMVLKVPKGVGGDVTGMISGKTLVASDLTKRQFYPGQKHIAVMLPFRLQGVSFDSISGTMNQIQKDNYLNFSLDFHSGVLMALDSLKTLGTRVQVDVYDTENKTSTIGDLIRKHNFEELDAIIGPLTQTGVEYTANVLSRDNIPVVSPITKYVKITENTFQSRPAESLLEAKSINYFKALDSLTNTILVFDAKTFTSNTKLKTAFPLASHVQSREDKKGKDAHYILVDDIAEKLKPGRNVVFLETDSEVFASNVTSILNSLNTGDFQIILATTNMNAAFEGNEVSNQHLSNLNFTFASVSKSYDEDIKNAFVTRYEKMYGVTPNKVAVRGFDVTMDVVLRLVTSTDLYASVSDAPLTEYVENKFAYKKQPIGGFYNDNVYLLRYDDLKIVEIKE